MASSHLASLPSRGAFTDEPLAPTIVASALRPYVPASTSASDDKVVVKTDGTNILVRQLSQSRARAEAKKRAQRAKAASGAKERAEAIAEEARRRERENRAALEAAAGAARTSASTSGRECDGEEGREERSAANPFSRKRQQGAAGAAGADDRAAKRGRETR